MRKSRRSGAKIVAAIVGILVVLFVLVVAFSVWYYTHGLPRTYPTKHDNVIWGFFNGLFIVPDFIISLFNDKVAIYQTPNSGHWYDAGFIFGLWVILGGGSNAGTAVGAARFLRG
jgi:hypothetical protein